MRRRARSWGSRAPISWRCSRPRCGPEKQVPLFVRAVARAAADEPRIRGLVAGTGVEQRTVEREAAQTNGAVRLLGRRDDVPALLAASDVVCLSSSVEAAPLVLVEAMAAGRPVLATRVGGVADLVGDGVNGMLVPPGDESAYASALVSLARDPERARRLGADGPHDVPRTLYARADGCGATTSCSTRSCPVRVLVCTNMWPSAARPTFGSFVQEQVDDLQRAGLEMDVLYIRGTESRANYARAAVHLRRRLVSRPYDLVHAHYGLTGAVALTQRKVPVVTTFHGSETGYVRLADPRLLGRRSDERADLRQLRRTRADEASARPRHPGRRRRRALPSARPAG